MPTRMRKHKTKKKATKGEEREMAGVSQSIAQKEALFLSSEIWKCCGSKDGLGKSTILIGLRLLKGE